MTQTLTTDYQSCPADEAPAFLRLAERLDRGECSTVATDHLTRRQINHVARVCGRCRPLEPWIEDVGNAVAAAAVREMVEGFNAR